MEFQKVIAVLGSIIVAAICMAIPVLLTLSFVLGWYGFVKLILIAFTICEFVTFVAYIYGEYEC